MNKERIRGQLSRVTGLIREIFLGGYGGDYQLDPIRHADPLNPPTMASELRSDLSELEEKLMIIGGTLGFVGGGIAANMIFKMEENVSWFLAASTRVALVTPIGVTVGAVLGVGMGFLAAKAINRVRSNILIRG